MKKGKYIYFPGFLVLCFFCQNAFSQKSQPSLAQTLEWFDQHVSNSVVANSSVFERERATIGDELKQQDIKWRFKNQGNCTLEWQGSIGDNLKESATPFLIARLNLSDFNPEKITISNSLTRRTEYYLTLNTAANKDKLEWQSKKKTLFRNREKWKSQDRITYSNSIQFTFDDEDVRDGAVRAFKNAISLCGGKNLTNQDDPFIRNDTKKNVPAGAVPILHK